MILKEDYHINMLMSNKDVYIRYNKWKSGEINKLLIPGLSGSGKSTLAKKIAEEYNCYCVELDKFRGNIYYSDEELKTDHPHIYYYFTKIWTKGDRHNIEKMEPEERRKEFKKFIYWLLERPERMVIEGALEKILYDNDEIRKTYPMVFKGTSMLKSMARMSWREFNREHPGRDPVDNLLWWMKWCTKYKQMTDQHNKVREKIMGDVDMNDYEEIDENALPLLTEAMGYKPQPIIFSDNDVYINYDKWKSGECNSLLITALSGSGKSTLAKKIAEKFNAYYVEIDVISFKIGILKAHRANWDYIEKNDKYLYKFLKEKNLPPTIMLQFKDYQDPKKSKIIDQYIYWLCFERDDLDKNRVVIEGGDVAVSLSNIKELSDLPIIIKGTSLAKSLLRRMQRTLNSDNHENDIFYILKLIFNGTYVSQYSKMYPEVDNARKAVMNQEYEEVHESLLPTLSLTLYHGSTMKFDEVKPLAFSNGNRLRKPEWAVFAFRQKEFAMIFAMSAVFDSDAFKDILYDEELDKYIHPIGWIERDGLGYKAVNMCRADKWDLIYERLSTFHPKVYVYTIEVPIDKNLSIIGTTPTLPEFTYAGKPKTIKREEIEVTEKLFASICQRVSKTVYHHYRKAKPHKKSLYGDAIAFILWDWQKRVHNRKIIMQKLDSGELQPGDDLGFLEESGIFSFIAPQKFTHQQLCEIYDKKETLNENKYIRIPYKSGNITQYIEGAYFDEDTRVWMRKPNAEEQARLDRINESYNAKTGKYIADNNDDKFLNVFEADEKEYLDRVYYKSFPNIRSGKPQPVIDIDGKQFRPRCEVIVLDGDKALIDPTNNRGGMGYTFPGGGIDPNESIAKGARRECEEEAKIIPNHIVYTGLAWTLEFKNKNVAYFGSISFICVATRGKEYKGYIKIEDRDSFVNNSKWVPISKLSDTHKMAVNIYKQQFLKEDVNGYEFIPLNLTQEGAYDPISGKPIPHTTQKYIGYMEAPEEEYINKISYIKDMHGDPYPIFEQDGIRYRASCEMLVLDGNKILIADKKNSSLGIKLPGGGIEEGESFVKTAKRECQEEALLTPFQCKYSGIAYIIEFANPVAVSGRIAFICVASGHKPYKGYVKVKDRDSFVNNMKWVDYTSIDLPEPYRLAIERYKQNLHESLGINMEFLNNEYYI